MLMDDTLDVCLAQLRIIKTKPYWEELANTDSQRSIFSIWQSQESFSYQWYFISWTKRKIHYWLWPCNEIFEWKMLVHLSLIINNIIITHFVTMYTLITIKRCIVILHLDSRTLFSISTRRKKERKKETNDKYYFLSWNKWDKPDHTYYIL